MIVPRHRCENCTQWSSTDSVWGDCLYASSKGANSEERLMEATYVRKGDERTAVLETKWTFGCVAWKSLKAALADGASR